MDMMINLKMLYRAAGMIAAGLVLMIVLGGVSDPAYAGGGPKIRSGAKYDANDNVVRWRRAKGADGYEVSYSTDPLFIREKKDVIKDGNKASHKIEGLKQGSSYYVRVRSFKGSRKSKKRSDWSYSYSPSASLKVKYRYLKSRSGKRLALRTLAKQKLHAYDTLQGGCTDGRYIYYVLLHKMKERCKIVKMRIKDGKLIKVSSVLRIDHGNDLCYDTGKEKIIACHANKKRVLTVIDPDTLKAKRVKVRLKKKIKGANGKVRKTIKGFTGIAYNEKRNCYVAKVKDYPNFVVIDSSFRVTRYIRPSKVLMYMSQGIECTDDMILLAKSREKKHHKYSIISMCDWDGKYLGKIDLIRPYELEHIFIDSGRLYFGVLDFHGKKDSRGRESFRNSYEAKVVKWY